MSWALTATAASVAINQIGQHNQASANVAYSKKQAKYNDAQNLKRARTQGMALDTNLVRARTEVAASLNAIENSEKEAVAQARVAAAAAGMGAGSHETVLNSFARKRNQAESNTIQQLVAELVSDSMKRKDIAVSATAGMSSSMMQGPSVGGSILAGAADFFKQTYGLSWSLGGSSSGNAAPGITDFSAGGPGVSLSGLDPFAGNFNL